MRLHFSHGINVNVAGVFESLRDVLNVVLSQLRVPHKHKVVGLTDEIFGHVRETPEGADKVHPQMTAVLADFPHRGSGPPLTVAGTVHFIEIEPHVTHRDSELGQVLGSVPPKDAMRGDDAMLPEVGERVCCRLEDDTGACCYLVIRVVREDYRGLSLGTPVLQDFCQEAPRHAALPRSLLRYHDRNHPFPSPVRRERGGQ